MTDEMNLESKPARAKAKTKNIKIKSMNDRWATGSVNIAAGMGGKLMAGEVCEVPADVAEALEDFDLVEGTRSAATCKLVGGVIQRDA